MESAIEVGRPFPLGASWEGSGVNFALYSAHAEAVELCLFETHGMRETARIPMIHRTGDIWHCFLPSARPGTIYGFRVHGPYAPKDGHRFNANKLLIDPYAKSLIGDLRWDEALFGYRQGPKQEWRADGRDSQQFVPKCVVIDPTFNWDGDRQLNVPMADTILYELHVKGFTQLHSGVPPEWRGKYLGLTVPAVIDYLKSLGVTTIALLPCQSFVSEQKLVVNGLHNYWGHNPVALFAPDRRYAVKDPTVEFKTMVKKLHAAGIEVVMSIGFNHTAEVDEAGPTLSFRGIDNKTYYLLDQQDLRQYRDYSGCGNTLNAEHPQVLKLMMDCLRYWASEMHIDGFRFDLASSLARRDDDFDPGGSFFNVIHQDPLLSHLKLMAEPWDKQPDSYHLGRFPAGWSEWNDQFRDGVRQFWRGQGGLRQTFATRLLGSPDLFHHQRREPSASINVVTYHDGFTLHDLVTYNQKHNEANLDDNRDGAEENYSWNCGTEGETDDAAINQLRDRQKRNFLTTLMLAQGVPLLLSGDEYGRTQAGNNNAFCQDNELSWMSWNFSARERELQAFVKRLIALRKSQPALRRRQFEVLNAEQDAQAITWLEASGDQLDEPAWQQWSARALAMLINGRKTGLVSANGEPVLGDHLLVLFNARNDAQQFTVPSPPDGALWQLVLDTSEPLGSSTPVYFNGKDTFRLEQRSIAILIEYVVEASTPR